MQNQLIRRKRAVTAMLRNPIYAVLSRAVSITNRSRSGATGDFIAKPMTISKLDRATQVPALDLRVCSGRPLGVSRSALKKEEDAIEELSRQAPLTPSSGVVT
jgi:hypothetical protein